MHLFSVCYLAAEFIDHLKKQENDRDEHFNKELKKKRENLEKEEEEKLKDLEKEEKELQQKQSEVRISREEELCVRIAGLCHGLGMYA